MLVLTPRSFVPLLVLATACSGDEFEQHTEDAGRTADAGTDAAHEAGFPDAATDSSAGGRPPVGDSSTADAPFTDGAPPGDARADAALTEAGPADAAPDVPETTPPKDPVSIVATIESDADDATWIFEQEGDYYAERLAFGSQGLNVEVGTDAEAGRVGLRFTLPVPRQATIVMATLRVFRVDGVVEPEATMRVQIFNSAQVPPFDPTHLHALPSEHDPRGLYAPTIGGFAVGAEGSSSDSPDLSTLVQHVVDLAAWRSGSPIAFVLLPDDMNGWAAFADTAGDGAKSELRVTYIPP